MLETNRLVLKPHTMANLEKMNKWRNDNELLYYDGDCPEVIEPIPIDSTKRYMEYIINNQDKESIRYGIHRKVDDELIGYCIIAFIDSYNRNCRIGLTIGEKRYWGKGYGSEII
ncbi:MAG: N-acetyltransferase, partial [Clostridiales bacterium]|nr:N-acetyltransferase [Clostridiales bacterium]